MHDDFDRCYRAVQSRDRRFDGWFVTAVLTTGIYCRPSCPVRLPLARNVSFHPTAAAAQAAGFRACRRCRPDAAPGSPEWNVRDDAVARAQRLQTARVLIETTALPFAEVAFAAGFRSIRQFNDSVRAACDTTPTVMRHSAITRSRRGGTYGGDGGQTLLLRLAVRSPFAYRGVFGHLAATAVPGCEEVRDGAFRRTLRLPHGNGVVSLAPRADHVEAKMSLADLRDLGAAIGRCRRLLDLDADPQAVIDALSTDAALRPVVAAAPGQRIARTVDEHELSIRTVLGQQVSTAAARTHAARLVTGYGEALADPAGGLTHTFPSVGRLTEIDPAHLAMPAARRSALRALIGALADGSVVLGPGCDWERARRQLRDVPGIGEWTAELIAMRGLGDPDAFPAADLGVRAAARRLGLPEGPQALTERSQGWRPWRSYAVQHLWATLDHPVNRWPPADDREAIA